MRLITTRSKEQKLERIMVFTFDDSVANQATFVAPLLQKYGFGATFSSPRDLEDQSVPPKVFPGLSRRRGIQ
jgi:hypothetical protein